jgi:hypothetical protein
LIESAALGGAVTESDNGLRVAPHQANLEINYTFRNQLHGAEFYQGRAAALQVSTARPRPGLARSGHSAFITDNPAAILNGLATTGAVTPNATVGGPYQVSASANGANSINFAWRLS